MTVKNVSSNEPAARAPDPIAPGRVAVVTGAASGIGFGLAERFAAHPMVEEVLYPGLPSFAGHATARKQMTGGFSGMLSVRIKGGERVSGVTILTSNDQGKIVRVAIHHRPLSAALHFSEAMGKALAGKVEADLFYSPALAAAN